MVVNDPKFEENVRAQTQGVIATIAGVLVLSTDALLVRLIPGDPLTVAFWRGALMALGFWAIYAMQSRFLGVATRTAPSRATLLAAVLFTGSTLCFVSAVKHTAVANALLIVATVPLSAAIISRVVLGERVRRATWLAIAGAIGGLGLIFVGDLGVGNLFGNALALGAAVFLGGYFTVLRSGRVDTALPALILAGIASAVVASLFADDLRVPIDNWPYVLLLGLVVMPVSFALISLGPKSLPAAEVGLIMLLEAVFGVAWAWVFLNEAPTWNAGVGGTLIILSLALRAVFR